ncbi:MAG: PilZ domain-containing protein [Bdellovibrio sp.]
MKLSYARERKTAVLKNISLTGAFVEFGQSPHEAHKVSLLLTVAGYSRELTAKVVWMNNRGYGLQFALRNGRDVRLLEDFIECAEELQHQRLDCLSQVFKKIA